MKTVVIIPIGIHSSGFKMMDPIGTSLVVQQLRVCSQCRGSGFDHQSGNSIPHAPTKTWHSQIKKLIKEITIKKKKTLLI